jgi:S1-C subfamily serine protease
VVPRAIRPRACLAALSLALAVPAFADDGAPGTIARVKTSIVAVGTFERLRNPQSSFAGTGFVVGDGKTVATNDHVLAKELAGERHESLAIAARAADGSIDIRPARKVAADTAHDLALLEIQGAPLPPLALGDSARVREGETYLFTGFPIGPVLGLHPVTHRAMIAALTPIVIPAARADKLDARAVRRLAAGAFAVFQLDGTAYPGNSGSPVYDAVSGEVVGIVNSVFVKGTKESALTSPSGITYAIPAVKLKQLLEQSNRFGPTRGVP